MGALHSMAHRTMMRAQRGIRERERERERPPTAALQAAKGRRTGGGPGGGPGGVKGTGDFGTESPYINAFSTIFLVFMGRILWQLESRNLK